jgi:hypothetical protein
LISWLLLLLGDADDNAAACTVTQVRAAAANNAISAAVLCV